MDNNKQVEAWLLLVKKLRRKHGLSQKEMARLLGISIGSLRKIEKGELPPRINIRPIFNIYQTFGILPRHQFDPSSWSDLGIE